MKTLNKTLTYLGTYNPAVFVLFVGGVLFIHAIYTAFANAPHVPTVFN